MSTSQTLIKKTIRVQSIRSDNPKGFGGVIFSGPSINELGDIYDAKEIIIINAPYTILSGIQVEKGQWWEVFGTSAIYIDEVNGYRIKRLQILPNQMQLLRPSGEHIVQLMADSGAFEGVGEVKARRLWERFGDELYAILDNSDISKLNLVVPPVIAHNIIDAWKKFGDTKTLQWLVQHGIKVHIGKKLLNFYGNETPKKIEEDPYRLLTFHGSWKVVDLIAIETFKLTKNDPRRIRGAIEEALYCRFAQGDTAVPLKSMRGMIKNLLSCYGYNWDEIINNGIKEGLGKGCFVMRNGKNQVLHALGPYVMEKTIAREITNRVMVQANTLDMRIINQQLNNFELLSGFTLNPEQRLAVTQTASNTFAIITGGAGTGKTTVLEALYQVYDQLGIKIYQMALSGRATKRMMEATGREATTIAGFLHHVKTVDFNEHTVIVIDEASMIDIGIMYRILRHIPPETKIVLVGDPGQLPPIGAGLVLHSLLDTKNIPVTELKVVNRYGGLIAKAATSIRTGDWLDLSENITDDICFIPCVSSELNDRILALYTNLLTDNENVQILEPIKSGRDFGTKHTNKNCQESFAKNATSIEVRNRESYKLEVLSIREGEPVICTKNHWDKELQNGSLGKVLEVYSEPKEQFNEDDIAIGTAYADIQWDDGKIRPLTEDMVDDVILAYSITIHKAQGSQWDTIIIPVYKSKNMDRSMIYTALTRATKKAIFIGDLDRAKYIIQEPPKALNRKTGLLDLLEEEYQKSIA